jgi:hypothetical protein
MKKIFLFLIAFLWIAGFGHCLEPAEQFPEDVITDSECEDYEAAKDKQEWLKNFREFKKQKTEQEQSEELEEI